MVKTGSKKFGQDGKIDTTLGSLETLRGLEYSDGPGDLEGPRSLKSLWGLLLKVTKLREVQRVRQVQNGPGGLNGTEGQEVSGRTRGSKRFRRSDTF